MDPINTADVGKAPDAQLEPKGSSLPPDKAAELKSTVNSVRENDQGRIRTRAQVLAQAPDVNGVKDTAPSSKTEDPKKTDATTKPDNVVDVEAPWRKHRSAEANAVIDKTLKRLDSSKQKIGDSTLSDFYKKNIANNKQWSDADIIAASKLKPENLNTPKAADLERKTVEAYNFGPGKVTAEQKAYRDLWGGIMLNSGPNGQSESPSAVANKVGHWKPEGGLNGSAKVANNTGHYSPGWSLTGLSRGDEFSIHHDFTSDAKAGAQYLSDPALRQSLAQIQGKTWRGSVGLPWSDKSLLSWGYDWNWTSAVQARFGSPMITPFE